MAWTSVSVVLTMSAIIDPIKGQVPQPPYQEVPGSPPPKDFGCTTTFDAVDLCTLDSRYYYFMGPYLYTIEKLSTNITGPRRVVDYFDGLSLPVIAAFSTGPLKPYMFIIDSSTTSNLKIYKFDLNTPYPRKPNAFTTISNIFPSSSNIPSPITAVLSATTPARVWFLGNSSTSNAASYAYNSGKTFGAMFTFMGLVAKGWNGTITGASMWYNMTSGAMQDFLYDNTGQAALVNNLLTIVPPGSPTALNTCPYWVPPQMNGCCTSRNTSTAQGSTASPPLTASSNPVTGASTGGTGGTTTNGAVTSALPISPGGEASTSAAAGFTVSASPSPVSFGATTVAAPSPAPPASTVNVPPSSAAPTPTVSGLLTSAAPGSTASATQPPMSMAAPSASCPSRNSPFVAQPKCAAAGPPDLAYTYGSPRASSTDISDILTAHNNYRRSVQASDMLALTWDDCTASNAQNWVDTCPSGHDVNSSRTIPGSSYCGQNIAYSTAPMTWTNVVGSWYAEVKDFAYCSSGNTFSSVGHYTQLMWAATAKVGCAAKIECTTGKWKYIYICNYCFGGNLDGNGSNKYCPWKQGAPCSACPSNTACKPGDCLCSA